MNEKIAQRIVAAVADRYAALEYAAHLGTEILVAPRLLACEDGLRSAGIDVGEFRRVTPHARRAMIAAAYQEVVAQRAFRDLVFLAGTANLGFDVG